MSHFINCFLLFVEWADKAEPGASPAERETEGGGETDGGAPKKQKGPGAWEEEAGQSLWDTTRGGKIIWKCKMEVHIFPHL